MTAAAPATDLSVLSALLKRLTSRRRLSQEDFDTVVQITIQKVVEVIGAEAITVFLLEDDGIRFAHIYYAPEASGGDPERAQRMRKRAEELRALRLKPGEGLVGAAIASGASELVEDARKDARFAKRIDSETGFETRSVLTVPLRAGGQTIGAIQALNKTVRGKRFTHEDQVLLEEVAGYTGDVLARIRDPDRKTDDGEMARYVSRLTRHRMFPFDQPYDPDENLLRLIGEPTLRRFLILPLKKTSSQALSVAMANPLDLQKRDSFALATQLEIAEIQVAPEAFLRQVIDRVFPPAGNMTEVTAAIADQYGAGGAETVQVSDNVTEESAPIVQLANRIIEDAYARGASDIHIEPQENEVLVRYRIDGEMQERLRVPASVNRALCARLKIMSDLDISERRLPQDGRIIFKQHSRAGIDIDLRVSTAPLSWGEKVCMRILDRTGSIRKLDQMGFSKHNVVVYRDMIIKPYGMILHVGPTGSGKTTTLYAALAEIQSPAINIQTAEDPIEYQLPGINQMLMRSDIGLNFSRALRCFLRQDPDVILVGEIRDRETAQIAIEAALTGHLLFSTLHTNDAPSTVNRMIDMGIEPFLVSSALLCVCAQRLMRRLCKCKEAYRPAPKETEGLGVDWPEDVTLHKPKGCPACSDTGYKGRVGIHELMVPGDEIRRLINEKAPADVLRKAAIAQGMIPLYVDALGKVREGVSSLDEALLTVRRD